MSYYSDTKRNFAIVAIALLLVGVMLCGIMTEGFRDWNPYCWFGHEYGEDGICAKCGAEKPVEQPEEPDEGGLEVDPEVQASKGMRLQSVKIPRPQYAEEGINPLAESAVQLTATVTPADAVNVNIGWAIAWNNAGSEWANGKTVTDYVELSSNSGLTVNVSCLQAFAEQVVIRAYVRSDEGIYATANVDYEVRILGFDFSIKNTWTGSSTAEPINWSMTTANLNATVDFVRVYSTIQNFDMNWAQAFGQSNNTLATITPHYSIGTTTNYEDGYRISVAPTAEYISALQAAGLSVSASAGQFKVVYDFEDETPDTTPDISVLELMMDAFTGDSLDTFSDYVAFRTALRNSADKAMFQIKIEALGGSEHNAATIYTIKFSAESLTAIVEHITLTPGTIVF